MTRHFVVDTSDGEDVFTSVGDAATYLFDHGFADDEVEPQWHLRWCLDRLVPGELMDVGDARLICSTDDRWRTDPSGDADAARSPDVTSGRSATSGRRVQLNALGLRDGQS